MNSTELLWLLTAYLTLGWLLMKGVAWSRKRWRIIPLRRGPMLLIFFLWPLILIFATSLRLKGSEGS